MEFGHAPVMPEEVIRYLAPTSGGVYVDGTLGGAGHAAAILEASAPDGVLVGFDRDSEALRAATHKLAPYGERAKLVHANFADMATELSRLGIRMIDGFLLDLGVSSHQLDTGERGFSFQQDGPLDMRMDRSLAATAAQMVNGLAEAELADIIWKFGEERWSRRIAAHIVKARELAPILTTMQLVDIVKRAIPRAKWEERLHPATRTFQALRIAVNDELASLEKGLAAGVRLLNKGGRGVVIAFHSLEDRIVKHAFREFARGCACPKDLPVCVCNRSPEVRILTGRAVVASEVETVSNPRARSAKLRGVEKL